jgi:hypothetical protein
VDVLLPGLACFHGKPKESFFPSDFCLLYYVSRQPLVVAIQIITCRYGGDLVAIFGPAGDASIYVGELSHFPPSHKFCYGGFPVFFALGPLRSILQSILWWN